MPQPISTDDVFPVFRKRCGELFDENLLLRAQVEVLERRVAELEQEKAQSPTPTTPPATAPPYEQDA